MAPVARTICGSGVVGSPRQSPRVSGSSARGKGACFPCSITATTRRACHQRTAPDATSKAQASATPAHGTRGVLPGPGGRGIGREVGKAHNSFVVKEAALP